MSSMGVPTHVWKHAVSNQTPSGKVPSPAGVRESQSTPTVTEAARRDTDRARELERATKEARQQARDRKTWAIRRFATQHAHLDQDHRTRYTPEERAEVRARGG